MSSLKERLSRFEDTPAFDHPTKERIERLSNYLLRSGSASIHDNSDSRLPTLRKSAADITSRSSHRTGEVPVGTDERSRSTSRSNGGNILASAARYIAAAVLPCAAGFTFVMLTDQAQQTASHPNAASGDPAVTAMTVAVSSPTTSDDTLYAGESAGLQLSLPGGESWQKTVENLKLLTKQKASKATSQSENDRVLAHLDAWLKAKTP